jgi:hypothetical protein
MSGEILAPTPGAFPGGSLDERGAGGDVFPEGLIDQPGCVWISYTVYIES